MYQTLMRKPFATILRMSTFHYGTPTRMANYQKYATHYLKAGLVRGILKFPPEELKYDEKWEKV